MAPPRKASPEQLQFMESNLEDFMSLNTPAAFEKFWTKVFREFFAKFPERESLIARKILPAKDATIQLPAGEVKNIISKAIDKRKEVRHTA